jgi:hypothetical protein
MDVGVFIPIGNNFWLISPVSPHYRPGDALNRDFTLTAERAGFDFAMSMLKAHGFGGATRLAMPGVPIAFDDFVRGWPGSAIAYGH